MARSENLTLSDVRAGSIGEEIGLQSGDALLRINDHPVRDIIDYHFYAGDDSLELEIRKPSGEIWVLQIEKDCMDDLGLTFCEDLPGGLRQCANKCMFCFIDQLPRGLRDTLYVKDDDYRYSFLYGNYISLTNLSSADWERILEMRLSPLYISVHTTNPRLRAKMFGNPAAGKIMEQLHKLVQGGITLHCQVVVCPGINDGPELDNTLRDLGSLWPSVASVAVVPVGITKYQSFEFPFFPVDQDEAGDIIHRVEKIRKELQDACGSGVVFAADELYLKAKQQIPPEEYYEDFSQLENGVGIVRMFLNDLACAAEDLPGEAPTGRKYLIVTGEAAYPVIQLAAKHLMGFVAGLDLEVLPVKNRFFGPLITVTGLLTGQDIAAALKGYVSQRGSGDAAAVLSSVTLKEGADIFLDGCTPGDIEKQTGVDLIVVENSAFGLVKGILGMEV